MTKQIITPASIRKNNLHTVMLAMHKYGVMSKREIQSKTSLSWGSVCTMIDELERQGLIVSIGKSTGNVGRRAVCYALNSKTNHVIGIDLNASGITAVLTDLSGGVIQRVFRSLNLLTYQKVLDALFSAVEDLLSHEECENVLGIGIAAQGVVNTETGRSVFFPQVNDWEDVPLVELFEERFKIKTYIMHDPDCIMVAEKIIEYKNHPDAKNIALLRLDKGIGMSLSVENVINTENYLCEIGHICVNSDGPRCVCGNRGCLEVYASVDGILKRYYELSGSAFDPNLDFKALALMAMEGNEVCRGLFADMSQYLGIALSTLANILPIDTVILYGTMIQVEELFDKEMTEHMNKHIFAKKSVSVKYSHLDLNAPALGAALSVSNTVINSMDFE